MEYLEITAGSPLQYMADVYGHGCSMNVCHLLSKVMSGNLWQENVCPENRSGLRSRKSPVLGKTICKNGEAFQKWSIVPSRLVKTDSYPSLQTQLLGQTLRNPNCCCASWSSTYFFNPDGEIAVAKASASRKRSLISIV